MDVVFLSRLQFAMTSMFHWTFVPLTLGLSVLLASMEIRYAFTGNELYLKMTKFWGKLFVINFVLGVVTGITLEFQFGMNWAEYSKYAGDIFGGPLALETLLTFFLESVFIGVWIFGWEKLSKKAHAVVIALVALGATLSAFWILVANAWMQHPVGYAIRNNRIELVDFGALITNPVAWLKFGHATTSGYALAAFFVMGVSAYHLLKKNQAEFFLKSFKTGAVFALLSSALMIGIGDFHAAEVARTQPSKFAAMESVWDTGTHVAYYTFLVPDPENERNRFEGPKIPSLVSFLAFNTADAEIKGLKDFPRNERPPVHMTFWSFRLMVGIGFAMLLLSFLAVLYTYRKTLERHPRFLMLLILSILLPYLGGQLGWIVAEVGRQPWIVYGIMKTSQGISTNVSTAQVYTSFIGLGLLYTSLAVIDIYLLTKFAKKGPDKDVSVFLKTTSEHTR
ncbi:MAG: cytochrome ubiquinol oxidase subunit I [Nitrospirota bacterium]